MMMTENSNASQADKGIREYARNYQKRKFAICRLRSGEKNPSYKKWNLASLPPDDFQDGDNIGILGGRLSDDLVCVDLDQDEVLRRADEFLPPTGMEDGRPSKPRSHRWYRVTDIPMEMVSTASGGIGGPRVKHFKHAETGKNLLDFIGTGGQAAVPPSLHPSGERRVWDADGEPACLPMVELWQAVCRLAKACGWRPKEKPKREKKKVSPAKRLPVRAATKLLPLWKRVLKGERLVERAALARSGHGGHDTTFRVARYLRNDLALPEEVGRDLLQRYNERLDEPWSDYELDHKWDSADGDHPDYPYGCKVVAGTDEPITDPHRLARSFLAQEPWVFWNGLYFRYEGTHYREVPEHEVRALLTKHIKQCFEADYQEQSHRYRADLDRGGSYARQPRPPISLSISRTQVSNTLLALESEALLSDTTGMPAWLDRRPTGNWLALANGLLDLDTGALQPHTPQWFSAVCLPYNYDSAAPCERWLATLRQNLESDEERIALLQEYFGYCLVATTEAQTGLVLVGEGANGKSVTLSGLHAMLGVANVSTVPLEDFGKRFSMAQTLGKLANICAEIGELDKTAEGTFKAFVSGDRMTFERKGKDAFSARPTARLVLSTNNVPRFMDRSEGVWRRLKLVPFNRRVPESERVPGMDQPGWWLNVGEVTGILNWALEGLRRLRSNSMRFTESAVCRAALEAHRQDSDPCRAFLLEHFVAASDANPLPTKQVYQDYVAWCQENGHRAVLSAQALGRQVRRVFGLAESRPQRCEGFTTEVQRAWSGLARRSVTDVTDL